MIIKLPRGLEVDLDNIPKDFDDQIQQCFAEFTEGTAEAYTFEDQLMFIDVCVRLLHREKDPDEEVLDLMKGYLEYEVREQGEVPQAEDYLSIQFMEDCYREGTRKHELYSQYTENRKENEKIEKLLIRIIRAVMAYGEEEAIRFPAWIPAAERMPEEGEEVLVSFDDGFVATTSVIDGDFELWDGSGEPLAWMQLPEPYNR